MLAAIKIGNGSIKCNMKYQKSQQHQDEISVNSKYERVLLQMQAIVIPLYNIFE